jgi:hypothetical protein
LGNEQIFYEHGEKVSTFGKIQEMHFKTDSQHVMKVSIGQLKLGIGILKILLADICNGTACF